MLNNASKVAALIIGIGTLATLANIGSMPAFADNPSPAEAKFDVNIQEALSVSITVPENWAKGDVGDFLRNKVSLKVSSNNANGFTASMTTKTADTDLKHQTVESTGDNAVIHTLSSDWTRSDVSATNFWGWSINDDEESGTYSPLVGLGSGPITLITREASIDPDSPITSRDIYFGAKANTTKVAGTYSNTVVISVVTGMVAPDDPTNPVIPDNPVTPSGPESDEVVEYSTTTGSSSNGVTTYTYRTTNDDDTTTTTTTVNDGDVRGSYTPPQGAKKSTETNISNNSAVIAALAIATGVAVGAGTLFFVLAKRKKDDDEE